MHRHHLLQAIESRTFLPRIVIVGGGIHGAAALRICALNQIPAVLLERSDYAAETSSRSSKMAHGGLRYLENFDFKQVREGIKARDQLFADAAHLCHPQRFLIPIKKGERWQRIKLAAGLSFYDLISSHPEFRHRWIGRDKLDGQALNPQHIELAGCFEYYDGIMNDTRIVIESIQDACARGAHSANYAQVYSIKRRDQRMQVEFIDRIENNKYSIECEIVINCAGPWIADLGYSELTPLQQRLRYSRGVHLIFERPWRDAALFLPLSEKSRYYFVWPHAAGTMVGTTEREVDRADFDPLPRQDEIAEILERTARDLPALGLDRESLIYAFAGVRTLPVRSQVGSVARLSRRHIWVESDGIISLLGGKWTSANITAHEGVTRAAKLLGISGAQRSLDGVSLPGALSAADLASLEQKLCARGINLTHSKRLVARYGAVAHSFIDHEEFRIELSPNLLAGELEISLKLEQAITIDDILRRRLDRELMPGHGLAELNATADYLREHGVDQSKISQQSTAYRERVAKVLGLIGKAV